MKGKIAQSTTPSRHVALFIETSQEFGRNVLMGIRDYERTLPERWSFFLNPGGAMKKIPEMRKGMFSGILARVNTPETAIRLWKTKIPFILLDPSSGILKPDFPAVPVISTDTSRIVQMAVEHLEGCGCRAFAFVHSQHKTVWSETRARMFQRLLGEKGLSCSVYPVQKKNMSWERNIRNLGQWLFALPRQLGVFAAMDERGRDVIEACRGVGLRVPEDVAVIGVDNDALLCELGEPSLTSVALNAYGAGFRAAWLLRRMMEGQDVSSNNRILVAPMHIFRRESTAIGFDRDELISAARNYLFKQIANSRFQIPELAVHCGVSRRLLETRFEQSAGQTLLQALTGLRMERARALLHDSHEPIATIACLCGFSGANYFTKTFRKHMGISPRKYRESCNKRLRSGV